MRGLIGLEWLVVAHMTRTVCIAIRSEKSRVAVVKRKCCRHGTAWGATHGLKSGVKDCRRGIVGVFGDYITQEEGGQFQCFSVMMSCKLLQGGSTPNS